MINGKGDSYKTTTILENLLNTEFWSGWLAKVKLDTYAILGFTGEKETARNNVQVLQAYLHSQHHIDQYDYYNSMPTSEATVEENKVEFVGL